MGQQDLTIHELVAKVERGDIRLPELQRQYVWRQTRVRDLLDSLYRGYPSGTILTWETDEIVATRDFAVDQETNGKSFQLLLDGQQRLTSLSAILRGKPVHVYDRVRPIDILFNLEHPDAPEIITEVNEDDGTDEEDTSEEDITDASEDELLKRFDRMAFVVSSKKLAAIRHWVSVTEVFREASNTPFLKAAGVTSMDDPRYENMTRVSNNSALSATINIVSTFSTMTNRMVKSRRYSSESIPLGQNSVAQILLWLKLRQLGGIP